MATVLANLKCPATIINSVEDHVHILFNLTRTVPLSKAVEEVKKSSSKWLKTQSAALTCFAWQAGYSAFSLSESNLPQVRQYIANQQEHHCTRTFQEEYLAFLQKHRIDYDERYLWEWCPEIEMNYRILILLGMISGNRNPKPFSWRATIESILGKVTTICNGRRPNTRPVFPIRGRL